jgi:hypothetical protein
MGEGEGIEWMYYVLIYKNRIMKPDEIVARRAKEREEKDEGVNLIKAYCKHIGKRSNYPPVQLQYSNNKNKVE